VEDVEKDIPWSDQAFVMDIAGEVNETPLKVWEVVIGAVEIAVEQADEVLAKQAEDDFASPASVGMEESQGSVAETPHLPALAVHFPSGFVAMKGALDGQRMGQALIDRLHSVGHAVENAQRTGRGERNAQNLG